MTATGLPINQQKPAVPKYLCRVCPRSAQVNLHGSGKFQRAAEATPNGVAILESYIFWPGQTANRRERGRERVPITFRIVEDAFSRRRRGCEPTCPLSADGRRAAISAGAACWRCPGSADNRGRELVGGSGSMTCPRVHEAAEIAHIAPSQHGDVAVRDKSSSSSLTAKNSGV